MCLKMTDSSRDWTASRLLDLNEEVVCSTDDHLLVIGYDQE